MSAAITTERPAESTWSARLHQPGWVLLPLRLFLGITFTYAGLDKLSDPHFFADAGDPLSVAAQMQGFAHTSPIGPLVEIAADHPTAAGLLISLAEIAIGLATLVGLFARLAAVGGAMLSLSFLLTVSWQTRPYYYGSDLGFFVSWLPIIAVGTAGVLSLDGAIRQPPGDAPLRSRRVLVQYGAAASVLAAVGLNAVWLAVATRERLPARKSAGPSGMSPSPSAPASPTPVAPPVSPAAGALVATSKVPVGGAVLVTDPTTGKQVHVMQPTAGRFQCLSAICTHAGCTVAWAGTTFNCPCHGAKFDAAGKVIQGPAGRPLDSVPVRVEGSSVVRG